MKVNFLMNQVNYLCKKVSTFFKKDLAVKVNVLDSKKLGLEEQEIMNNIRFSSKLRAEDIMIPRAEICAIDSNIAYKEFDDLVQKHRHTRYPVFSNSLDDIKGYINIKDMIVSNKKEFHVDKLIRNILFVPSSAKLIKLLFRMRKHNSHIAIVVDELGGTDGLITLEDIVENIIGDIKDEHDIEHNNEILQISKNNYLVDARASIEEFKKVFGVSLSNVEVEYETVGGAIISIAKNVPKKGELIFHPSGVEFEIIDSSPMKIKKAYARKISKK